MKIKVESEKIIKAVKKLDGIEIVLENPDDAKEAINLILRKAELFKSDEYGKLKDVKVASYQRYETSAVDYKMIFLLEFLFEDDVSLDAKVAGIEALQEFFDKA
jgi:copper chaperone CopZ